jgi:hypothetical protein
MAEGTAQEFSLNGPCLYLNITPYMITLKWQYKFTISYKDTGSDPFLPTSMSYNTQTRSATLFEVYPQKLKLLHVLLHTAELWRCQSGTFLLLSATFRQASIQMGFTELTLVAIYRWTSECTVCRFYFSLHRIWLWKLPVQSHTSLLQ